MTDSAASDRKKWLVFLIIAVLSLVADQATKVWARGALPVARYDGSTTPACVVPNDMMVRHTIVNGQETDVPPTCRGEVAHVIDSFWAWKLSMNPGSAFGLFSSQTGARIGLSVVGIIAVFGMLWMLRRSRYDQRVLHWALALVAGGAIGNLIDRIYFGVVTDFILWHVGTYYPKPQRWEHEWPVFNVADAVLVAGVILMIIDIQKEGRKDKSRKAGRDEKARAAGIVRV